MTRIGMALAAPLFAASIAMMTTAHANDANDKGASQNTQAQLDQSSPAASTSNSAGTSSNGDDNATRRNAREHPPTARMDAATPKTKPSSSESTASHGPTSVMNRATPEEKASRADTTKSGEASSKPQ